LWGFFVSSETSKQKYFETTSCQCLLNSSSRKDLNFQLKSTNLHILHVPKLTQTYG